MSRPTKVIIEPSALLHNVAQIKKYAPGKKVIAMVKANGYGCGVKQIVPHLEGQVDAFGVACSEEAMIIRSLGCTTSCILFQGVFSADEYALAVKHQFDCVIHNQQQLEWLVNTPLAQKITIWVKVNTGMNRIGFNLSDLEGVLSALKQCTWVDKSLGLMTHLSSSDEPNLVANANQIDLFNKIISQGIAQRSIANSAAIISMPHSHADAVRPGIMLYGISPFANKTSTDLGLLPVMRFVSAVTAVHQIPANAEVGYSGTWKSSKPSTIGIVAVGYGDGYPRHIAPGTPVWVHGAEAVIIGRVSMDMMAIDLTDRPDVSLGDSVELWGTHILVERIAKAAGTIPYELTCQISERVRHG